MIDYLFNHNSRSYFDVYNAYVTAYPNKPTWIFEEIAAMFDFQSELMNRVATDILYPQTRESAYGFAARCDYDPIEADGAVGTVTVTLTSAQAKTLNIGYQFGGVSNATGNIVILEVTANSSSGGTDTISCPVKQQQTFSSINIGSITSTEDWSDYPIRGYLNIIRSSISLSIGGDTWTRVDNFDSSISDSKHFKLIYQSSGKTRIQFGNGINGLKPTLNDVMYATFSTTEGLIGRLNAGEININIGGDSAISSLTNATDCTEGNNSESVASIVRNARANARLRYMVWSKEDLETAATQSDADCIKAFGIPGTGTASTIIIETGGIAPSGALKTTVDDYVTALTQFGAMPITILDPTFVPVNISGTVSVRDGFSSSTVLNLVEFACTLVVASNDVEVIEHYDDYGIESCRTNVINTLWSWAFTSDDNDALTVIIETWKSLLGTDDFRQFGQDVEVGDLWSIVNELYEYGADVFNLTAPTGNVTVTSTEISNPGTITITEV